MPLPTIPRADLIEIVRASLPQQMPTIDAAALMRVAETSTFIAFGGYDLPDPETGLPVGCPLVQANIGQGTDAGNPELPGETAFTDRFDRLMRDKLGLAGVAQVTA